MARLSFPGTVLFASANGPYERELIFEHADLYARRHREVHLKLDGRAWVIRADAGPTLVLCAGCYRHIERVTYTIAARMLCLRCAKKVAH